MYCLGSRVICSFDKDGLGIGALTMLGAGFSMVEKMKRIELFPLILVTLALLVIIGVNRNCYCQDNSYSLMVQQSPAGGGTVSPDPGIHRISIDDSVTLTANPKPGYRFVYWMGDVSDTSSAQTSVVIDSPKIVVAVFERISHDIGIQVGGVGRGSGGGGSRQDSEQGHGAGFVSSGQEPEGSYVPGGGGGGGTLTPSRTETGSGGRTLGTSGSLPRNKVGSAGNGFDQFVIIPPYDDSGNGDVDPDDSDDDDDIIIVVDDPSIPEPATIALLGGGALLFLRRRR